MSKVVLFGAGASHGAGGVIPETPPLGTGLFFVLRHAFPATWGRIPSPIAALFDADFEEGMGAVFQDHATWVAPLMRDMALYFARFRFGEARSNAYRRFVDGTLGAGVERDVLFSTLNYELLLELAVTSADRRVDYWSFPPPPGEISVMKVHGSCNFLPYASGIGSNLTLSPSFVFETGGFNAVGSAHEIEDYLSREPSLYPIMCLYMPGKGTHMGPQTMQRVQASWREHVLASDKVILIGVRPNDGDSHLWDAIADTEADVYHVGADNDLARWSTTRRARNPSQRLGDRFEDAVEDLLSVLV